MEEEAEERCREKGSQGGCKHEKIPRFALALRCRGPSTPRSSGWAPADSQQEHRPESSRNSILPQAEWAWDWSFLGSILGFSLMKPEIEKPVKLTWTSTELCNNIVLFWATNFVIICYSSIRTLTQASPASCMTVYSCKYGCLKEDKVQS